MKKSFVTALVVGSCMLASETSASAQDAPDTTQSLLAARSEIPILNRHRILDDEEKENPEEQDTAEAEPEENDAEEPEEPESAEDEPDEPDSPEEEEPASAEEEEPDSPAEEEEAEAPEEAEEEPEANDDAADDEQEAAKGKGGEAKVEEGSMGPALDQEAEDQRAQEKEEALAAKQGEADEAEEQEQQETEAKEEQETEEAEAKDQEEADEAAQDEAEEKEEAEQADADDAAEADEAEEKEQVEADEADEADEAEEKEEPEEEDEPEGANDDAAEDNADAAEEKDDDGQAKVEESSVGPGGEEVVDDDETDPDGERRAQTAQKAEAQEAQEQEENEAAEAKEEEDADKAEAQEQEEADDNAAAEQEEAEDKEADDDAAAEQEEADDKEEADEKEEADQEQADADDQEEAADEAQEDNSDGQEDASEEKADDAEDVKEDDGDGQVHAEESAVGPTDDSGPNAQGKADTVKYESDVVELDEENDPIWYRAHMSTYPCYKFTEGSVYNIQLLKNLDGDWSTSGVDPKKSSTIYWNLCHYTDTTDCNGRDDTFAYSKTADGSCSLLTSDSPQAEVTEDVTRSDPSDGSEQTGLRLLRAGGDVCPADETRLLSFTVDIWCNDDSPRNPSGLKAYPTPVDEDQDPCVVYVSMQHAAGCPVLNYQPVLNVLGVFMIFCGVTLQYFGRRVQRMFMKMVVSFAAFIITLAICFKLNWLAMFDPTEPDENKSAFLCFFAFLLAFIALITVNWAFKKFLRFAPTFIGLCAGFWFSIYVIAAINGVGGIFTEQLPSQAGASKDIVGPMWGGGIEVMGSILGGLIGYQYSMVFILLIQTFISSYLIVRGSTLIMNLGFPNELVLMSSVSNETNGLVKLPTMFYIYSMVILGLWGGSFYYQLKDAWDESAQNFCDEDD